MVRAATNDQRSRRCTRRSGSGKWRARSPRGSYPGENVLPNVYPVVEQLAARRRRDSGRVPGAGCLDVRVYERRHRPRRRGGRRGGDGRVNVEIHGLGCGVYGSPRPRRPTPWCGSAVRPQTRCSAMRAGVYRRPDASRLPSSWICTKSIPSQATSAVQRRGRWRRP
jgi:hypothetical protein